VIGAMKIVNARWPAIPEDATNISVFAVRPTFPPERITTPVLKVKDSHGFAFFVLQSVSVPGFQRCLCKPANLCLVIKACVLIFIYSISRKLCGNTALSNNTE
jgi:hypothetical protein